MARSTVRTGWLPTNAATAIMAVGDDQVPDSPAMRTPPYRREVDGISDESHQEQKWRTTREKCIQFFSQAKGGRGSALVCGFERKKGELANGNTSSAVAMSMPMKLRLARRALTRYPCTCIASTIGLG